jgi:hypothetical protein
LTDLQLIDTLEGYKKIIMIMEKKMKNKGLSLLMASLVGFFGAINAVNTMAIPPQARVNTFPVQPQAFSSNYKEERMDPYYSNTESGMRHKLYWLDAYNPNYCLLIKDFPFDYYIAVLKDHIAVLERKIELKDDKSKNKNMRWGVVFAGLSALSLCGVYGAYCHICRINPNIDLLEAKVVSAIFPGFFSLLTGFEATGCFYKASYHEERLARRLRRDKRILATLEKQKTALDAKKLGNSVDNAINSVGTGITSVVDHVVQAFNAPVGK